MRRSAIAMACGLCLLSTGVVASEPEAPPAEVPAPEAPAVAPAPPAPLPPPVVAAPDAPKKKPEFFWIGTSVVFRNIYNATTGKFPGVGLSYSLNLSMRLTDTVMACLDLSAATPISAFNPNPSFGLGPAFVVAPRFVINPEILYSASFYYPTDPAPPADSPARQVNHSIGASVAFGFIRPPVIVAPVAIASYNLTQKQWVVVFAFKLGISLFAL